MREFGRIMTGFIVLLWGLAALNCQTKSDVKSLRVAAASSLTDVLVALKGRFETQFPETKVALEFAGSQTLKLQINQGAPADVFISAHREHLVSLVEDGDVAGSEVLAGNRLALILPRDNPAGITTFADLPKAERLVIGTAESPIGNYTRALLNRAGKELGASFEAEVLKRAVSMEHNVRLLRAKVELGEADAAIVYHSDTIGRSKLKTVTIPAAFDVPTLCFMGLSTRTEHKGLAQRWMAFLRSEAARPVWKRHGFIVQ